MEESPVYKICKEHKIEMGELVGFSDSSWQDCPDTGKSTCCYHLHQLLENSQLVGNIGTPVLDKINSCSYSIIELSSFQLEKVKKLKLDFGVLLNIAPDH